MRCAAILLVTLALVTPSRAAMFNVGGFAGSTPIIDVRGPLLDGDDRKFDLFADALPRAIVRLDSPGGQLWAGLSIGEAIARKGYATFVASGRVCASACGFAWLAGQPRIKAQLAMVGFHGAYAQIDGRTEQTGSGNAMVGAYMTNLHLGYKAVIFATSARPTDMLWLTPESAKEFEISYESRDEVETTFWNEPPAMGLPASMTSTWPEPKKVGTAEVHPVIGTISPYSPPRKPQPQPTHHAAAANVNPKNSGGAFDPSDIDKILNTQPR